MTENTRLNALNEKLAELKLAHFAHLLTEDTKTLKPNTKSEIIRLIDKWSDHELAERSSRAIGTRVRGAKFVRIQTIDGFDFNYNKSTRSIKRAYMDLHNEIMKGSLPRAVFVGTAGLGKTHLARSLGYAACQAKKTVLFINAAKMINNLQTAKSCHQLEKELSKYRRPRLLIIDELGYVSMDMEASNLIFQVISARHDEGLGTVVTSNIPFGEWNQIFAGNAIAHAVVDRLTDNASVFYLEGTSYREYMRKTKTKKN